MNELDDLLTPENCIFLFVDLQAGLAFATESIARQALVNNAVALAKAAVAFSVPVILTTSATKVYSGPVLDAVKDVLPDTPVFERRSMNAWEDDATRDAIANSGRRKLIFCGMLTEACISFPVLSSIRAGYEPYVVADACGGSSPASHEAALSRMAHKGAQLTSWLQVVLELQRDWTRKETYAPVRAIIEENGGGYGIGLRYASHMLPKP
ncbi:hydrolase [Burkholderia sp. PU8-34]